MLLYYPLLDKALAILVLVLKGLATPITLLLQRELG